MESCRHSIRNHLLQTQNSRSIYDAIEVGLKEEYPKILHNYLLLQDYVGGEKWLENYKNAARALEKMFILVDECREADQAGKSKIEEKLGATPHGGLNVAHA